MALMKNAQPKPHIVINMAMSADGKISTRKRESFRLGSAEDKKLMEMLRARSDAVIIGAETLRVDGFPLIVQDRALAKKRREQGKPPHPVNAVMSGSLAFPLTRKLFHFPDTEKIVFTLRSAPARKIARIERLAEVIALPGAMVSPRRVVGRLARRGCAMILVEGGGRLNFAFLQAGLVDELYITLTPTIIGGADAPTIADGRGFLKRSRLALRLISSRRIGDELFLRYRIAE